MIAEGRYTGGRVKYGYKVVEGKLVEDETEQCAIMLIKKYRSLKWSYFKIGRVLKDAGYVSRTGEQLSHKSIKHILERTTVAWLRNMIWSKMNVSAELVAPEGRFG